MNILQIGELAGALSGDYVERTWYTAVTDVPALKEFCYGELARMDGE